MATNPILSDPRFSDTQGSPRTPASRKLKGLWVTSYTGWMLFDPLPIPLPSPPGETPEDFLH